MTGFARPRIVVSRCLGFAACRHDGAKLSDDREAEIEARVRSADPYSAPTGAAVGMQMPMTDAVTRYLDRLAAGFDYSLRVMEFVLDCANGAAFEAAPRLLERAQPLIAGAREVGDAAGGVAAHAQPGQGPAAQGGRQRREPHRQPAPPGAPARRQIRTGA